MTKKITRQRPFAGYIHVHNRCDWLISAAKKVWLEDGMLLSRETALRFFRLKYRQTAGSNLLSAISEAKKAGLIGKTHRGLIYLIGINEPKLDIAATS